ncbi:DUF4160 domain-containing protein [Methylomonas rivi]|uniref:DUF4160 domain-containing protein n=1 Tax=Methylomonas rivi TaxID=2952226 RepID=A0ABT1U5E3_9GAMM|nr:DUF4160 domain-containing protein [Methylomonas sp. WSC-6]MBS4052707.1 DUF4160 domain-containing protein [Methylomonas sp.]MCQ8129074.1 DUF4160 domain-containing protein [Methylomonas sp. WSC-6]
MPTISMFYGILIKMFFDDHAPPHFHAEYGEFELAIAINPIKIIQGDAPKRVKSMVLEWTALHQEELLLDWELCKNLQPPVAIEPLE